MGNFELLDLVNLVVVCTFPCLFLRPNMGRLKSVDEINLRANSPVLTNIVSEPIFC